jgi:hypothetical protein
MAMSQVNSASWLIHLARACRRFLGDAVPEIPELPFKRGVSSRLMSSFAPRLSSLSHHSSADEVAAFPGSCLASKGFSSGLVSRRCAFTISATVPWQSLLRSLNIMAISERLGPCSVAFALQVYVTSLGRFKDGDSGEDRRWFSADCYHCCY